MVQDKKSQKISKEKSGTERLSKKERCQMKAEKKQLKAMAKNGPQRPEKPGMMSLEDHVEEVVKFSSVEEMDRADGTPPAKELPPAPAASNVTDGASEVVKFSIFEEMNNADGMRLEGEELPPAPAASNVTDGASEDWLTGFLKNLLFCGCGMRRK